MNVSPASPSFAAKWTTIALVSISQMLAMSPWFSASSTVPQLAREWSLGETGQAWLTMSVQAGFVTGAVISALLNLPDRIPLRALIAACAFGGAFFNAAIAWIDAGLGPSLVLRFLTGFCLAGVYPPGMKLVATWCREDRGLGIGLLVGAITAGSAAPHLINALWAGGEEAGGMPPWRPVMLAVSGIAAAGGVLAILFATPGPHHAARAPFRWRQAGRALADPPVRLANYGYLGHMWALYAMWTWVPIFLLASHEAAGLGAAGGRLAGFAAIGAGAIGCLVAGALADRWGRTIVAGGSLALSGACCLAVGWFFPSPGLLTWICVLWGFAVVADSAQFSAAVSELSDPRYVGTALTVQTSLGFLLTLPAIWIVPHLVSRIGWAWTFTVLAAGPAFGLVSMGRLRRLPEAARMASGRR